MTSIVSGPGAGDSLESTSDLLARAKDGDVIAIDALFARSLPPLRRWARGRLPQYARHMADTQDLVQETVIQTLRHLENAGEIFRALNVAREPVKVIRGARKHADYSRALVRQI